jgi:hypothetical protein
MAKIRTDYEEGRLQLTPAGHPQLATLKANNFLLVTLSKISKICFEQNFFYQKEVFGKKYLCPQAKNTKMVFFCFLYRVLWWHCFKDQKHSWKVVMKIQCIEGQTCISWGIYRLPEVSLGPPISYHSTTCRRPPLKRPFSHFRGGSLQGPWPAPAAVLDTPCHTGFLSTPSFGRCE